jgi:hypothetical protein
VRRPLKHFYAYYKMCASNAADLRAGTVTKRCELLLNQLKVNKKEYRVGKTLIFFKSFDIIEAMDKVPLEAAPSPSRLTTPSRLLPHVGLPHMAGARVEDRRVRGGAPVLLPHVQGLPGTWIRIELTTCAR